LIDDYGDRMSKVVRMARPTGVLALISCGYGALASLASLALFLEAARHPEQGLGLWIVLCVFVVPLVGVGAGILAARAERAVTGLRHPRRPVWVLAALGAIGLAHWVALAAWVPVIVVTGLLGPSHRLDDAFEGALMVSPSWVFAGLSAAVLYGTLRVLRARSWEGVTGERRSRLPRLPTAVVAAGVYGVCMGIPALVMSLLALEERALGIAVGGWMVAGVVGAGGLAAYAIWLYRGLPHALGRQVDSLRFAETFGALWGVHWCIPFALALLPVWDDGSARFLFAVVTAMFWVVGVGCWTGGRVFRALPA